MRIDDLYKKKQPLILHLVRAFFPMNECQKVAKPTKRLQKYCVFTGKRTQLYCSTSSNAVMHESALKEFDAWVHDRIDKRDATIAFVVRDSMYKKIHESTGIDPWKADKEMKQNNKRAYLRRVEERKKRNTIGNMI